MTSNTETNIKTVLITGASSGFGRAAARKYALAGHRVVACARRESRLVELAQAFPELVLPKVLDVTDQQQVLETIAELPESHAEVDILVNSAGLALGLGGGQEANLDDWEAMVDTNIKGVMYLCRAVLPGMVKRGQGHIVNLGSVAASWPYPGGNAYGGSKAFVQQFSRNLRVDLHGKNIRVSNIEPGMCETEFSVVRFNGDENKARDVYAGMTPLSAEDVAELIYYTTMLPAHININQLEVMPVAQSWSAFAVHREL